MNNYLIFLFLFIIMCSTFFKNPNKEGNEQKIPMNVTVDIEDDNTAVVESFAPTMGLEPMSTNTNVPAGNFSAENPFGLKENLKTSDDARNYTTLSIMHQHGKKDMPKKVFNFMGDESFEKPEPLSQADTDKKYLENPSFTGFFGEKYYCNDYDHRGCRGLEKYEIKQTQQKKGQRMKNEQKYFDILHEEKIRKKEKEKRRLQDLIQNRGSKKSNDNINA